MKVYTLITHEPFVPGFEPFDLPVLYATRELAELAAKDYNDEFNDDEPATVEEIEVQQ